MAKNYSNILNEIYQPAEDSILLASALKKKVKGKRVLDVGTGSGILAQKAQEAGAQQVDAVDRHRPSVQYARLKGIRAHYSYFFSDVHKKYDVILCNPPYLPRDAREPLSSQRSTTGGEKGDEWVCTFLKQAPSHLTPTGSIMLLLSSLTPRTRIENLLKRKKLHATRIKTKKLFMETLEVWELKRNV